MNAPKHTPGPWRAFQRPGEVGTNYWRLALKDEPSDSMAGYCGEANAHLLEAAPDLLETLEAAYRECKCSDEVMRTMRAAIAKARGQS